MAGSSAAVPSYLASPTGGTALNPAVAQGPSFRSIRAFEPVLVDYAFAYNGYLSDHTRIFAIKGLPDAMLQAHAVVLTIQRMLKRTAKPGVASGSLYECALEMARDAGFADHFMGAGAQRIRFVGHGIGLEIDEFPFLAKGQNMPLEENMVLAMEPKLVFPGKGVIGIENTHVVTHSGVRQLTCFREDIVIV
jgi:Xaa-Pro aminopeptidase